MEWPIAARTLLAAINAKQLLINSVQSKPKLDLSDITEILTAQFVIDLEFLCESGCMADMIDVRCKTTEENQAVIYVGEEDPWSDECIMARFDMAEGIDKTRLRKEILPIREG